MIRGNPKKIKYGRIESWRQLDKRVDHQQTYTDAPRRVELLLFCPAERFEEMVSNSGKVSTKLGKVNNPPITPWSYPKSLCVIDKDLWEYAFSWPMRERERERGGWGCESSLCSYCSLSFLQGTKIKSDLIIIWGKVPLPLRVYKDWLYHDFINMYIMTSTWNQL